MTLPKKRGPGRPRKTASKKVVPKPIVLDDMVIPDETDPPPKKAEAVEVKTCKGYEYLEMLLKDRAKEVAALVAKFEARYAVELVYIAKFTAFKCMKGAKHADWITLNELMKRYDCRIPPVSMWQHPQRPYEKKRIY